MMTILALLFSTTAAIAEPFGNTVGLCVKFSQGEPQSAAPFEFVPSVHGIYRIEIREMRGRAFGRGNLKIG